MQTIRNCEKEQEAIKYRNLTGNQKSKAMAMQEIWDLLERIQHVCHFIASKH